MYPAACCRGLLQRHLRGSCPSQPRWFIHRQCLSTSSPLSSQQWDYDVIICGAGVVGSTLASTLLKETSGDISICIVDVRPPPKWGAYAEPTESSPAIDPRVYAMSPRSQTILNNVGAWDLISKAGRTKPYTAMQIWDAQSDGFVRFDGEDIINEDSTQNGILGCIAEDAALTAALFESMKGYVNSTAEGEASPSKKKGVDCFFGRTASKIHVPAYKTHSLGPAVVDLMDVKDRSVKTVTCRLVVGADGAQSAVRRLAGIPSWGWTYGQEAVVATVEMPADSEGEATAWQRYLPTGPIALLPLWEGYGNIVWSVPTTRAKQLTAMKNSEFIGELNKALNEDFETTAESTPVLNTTGQTVPHTIPGLLRHAVLAPVNTVQNELKALVGTVSSVFELNSAGYYTESSKNGGSRGSAGKAVGKQKPPVISADGLESRLVSFPLQFQQASTYYAPRVALAGDAAHSIHPQAGQGLNLGIEDVSMLCDAILGAMSAGADYGDTDVLQKYGQQSYLRNLQMLLTVDAINATFAAGNAEVHAPLMSSDGKDTNTTLPLRAGVIGSLLSISEKVIPGAAFRDARALGMLALNASPSLKKRVAAYAMGLQR